jgi:RNA-directed DNA polymerase
MRIRHKNFITLDDVGELLGIPVATLVYFSSNMQKNVREIEIPKKSALNETRTITIPNRALKAIQRKIKATVLDTYKYKPYVFGLGANTLKDHAKIHEGKKNLVQVDLKDFYPSIHHELVYKMWMEKFGFNSDASRILTKITTMDGGLKQGFPTSSHVAGIVAEEFTSAINEHCINNGMKFSQYVDDLNISGENIDYKTVFKIIIPLGRQYRLSIKKRKTKINAPLDGKVITGVSLFGQQTRATKAVRKRAISALKYLASTPNDKHAKNRVVGYLGFLKHLNKKDGKNYKKLKDAILPSKRKNRHKLH